MPEPESLSAQETNPNPHPAPTETSRGWHPLRLPCTPLISAAVSSMKSLK